MIRTVFIMMILMVPFISCTSLNDAAMKGDASAVQKLISQGEDINAKDSKGKTALMYAAEKGQAETARILIDAAADVNAKDNDGKTALMYAAESNNLEIVKYLIAGKADVEAVDNSGNIALYKTKKKSKVREEILLYSVKYRAQFLCRINTLFKYLEKYPEITVSYVGQKDSGIGTVYYGDGVKLEQNQGIWPEMISYLKKYGVVFTDDLNNALDKCGK